MTLSQQSDRAEGGPSTAEQIAVATEAAQHWANGAATGDWTAFMQLLAEDVRFSVPVPSVPPTGATRDEAARFFSYLADNLRTELTVKKVLANGGTVGFEIRAEGIHQSRRIVNHILLVLVMDEGVVTGFREYVAWPDGLEDTTVGRDLFD